MNRSKLESSTWFTGGSPETPSTQSGNSSESKRWICMKHYRCTRTPSPWRKKTVFLCCVPCFHPRWGERADHVRQAIGLADFSTNQDMNSLTAEFFAYPGHREFSYGSPERGGRGGGGTGHPLPTRTHCSASGSLVAWVRTEASIWKWPASPTQISPLLKVQ